MLSLDLVKFNSQLWNVFYLLELVKTPQVAGPRATDIAPVSVARSHIMRGENFSA
jgi:hypothetical protein